MLRFLQMSCQKQISSFARVATGCLTATSRLNSTIFDADAILTLKPQQNRHDATREGVFGVEKTTGRGVGLSGTGFEARPNAIPPLLMERLAGRLCERIGGFVNFQQPDSAC